jgi:hypothetical protein
VLGADILRIESWNYGVFGKEKKRRLRSSDFCEGWVEWDWMMEWKLCGGDEGEWLWERLLFEGKVPRSKVWPLIGAELIFAVGPIRDVGERLNPDSPKKVAIH